MCRIISVFKYYSKVEKLSSLNFVLNSNISRVSDPTAFVFKVN